MKRSLDPGTPLLPAIVFHLLPLAAFGSPEIRPAVASVPSAAQPMQRVWRMENARVLSRDLDKRWDGTVLMVGQGQTMLAVDLPTGRIRWSATDALPTTWEAWVDISSEHVAVTSQESIVAYSADTGRRMWARAPPCDFIPLRVRGEVVVGQCVSKTVGCEPVGGEPIVALDIQSGAERWRHLPKVGLFGDGLDENRLFYIDNVRRPPPGPHRGHLVALELTSGRVVWRVPLDDAEGTLVIGEHTVIVLASFMTGFSKTDGKRLWRRDPSSSDSNEMVASIGERGAVVDDHLVLPGRIGFVSYAMRSGRPGRVIPYPSQWKSGLSRRRASLHSCGQVLLARTRDARSRGPSSIYAWVNAKWAEVASPGEDSEIAATGGGCAVVSTGDLLEAYMLAPPTAPDQ